jgi:hypothetical protein
MLSSPPLLQGLPALERQVTSALAAAAAAQLMPPGPPCSAHQLTQRQQQLLAFEVHEQVRTRGAVDPVANWRTGAFLAVYASYSALR